MTDAMTRDEVAAHLRLGGSVFAEEEADLLMAEFTGVDLVDAVQARVGGEPLEHIVGWTLFAGLRVDVGPGVFVPRRRTELLFHLALEHLPRRGTFVELCCGAAPVATAVATARAGATVYATDNSPEAALCAMENLDTLGGTVCVGDMADGLPADLFGRVDVVAVNAPYVPSAELELMPREARLHEPVAALDGGAEGVDLQARAARAARRLLRPGGLVLVETSRRQIGATEDVLAAVGMATNVVLDDEVDGTCVIGTKPSS